MATKKIYQRENLVVLAFAQNECCLTIIPIYKASKRLVVNCEKGTWKVGNSDSTRKIGEYDYYSGSGIIGVYDKTDVKHLNAMVDEAENNAYRKSRPSG
jgi:hypothetical protein